MSPRKPGTCSSPPVLVLLVLSIFLVNERSIMARKKRALRRTMSLRRDPETRQPILPSIISRWVSKLKAPFTRVFWEDAFERTDDETLVDNKLLSYSYIEAGLIETVGSYVSLRQPLYERFSENLQIASWRTLWCFTRKDSRQMICAVLRKPMVGGICFVCRRLHAHMPCS
jgi:hypothetical protein